MKSTASNMVQLIKTTCTPYALLHGTVTSFKGNKKTEFKKPELRRFRIEKKANKETAASVARRQYNKNDSAYMSHEERKTLYCGHKCFECKEEGHYSRLSA